MVGQVQWCTGCDTFTLPDPHGAEGGFTCPVCAGRLEPLPPQSVGLGPTYNSEQQDIGQSVADLRMPLQVSLLGRALAERIEELEGYEHGDQGDGSSAATPAALAAIQRFPVDSDSCWVLHTAILNLPSTESSPFLKGQVFECLTANFTLAVSGEENIEVSGGLVACNSALTDVTHEKVSGRFALVPRGTISFIEKAHRARALGAIGVIVIQSKGGVWPYVMQGKEDDFVLGKEMTGAERSSSPFPVVMVNCTHDESLRKFAADQKKEKVILRIRRSGAACPICLSNYTIGTTAVRLYCSHLFHESCALQWLKTHDTCPLCRVHITAGGDIENSTDEVTSADPWYG